MIRLHAGSFFMDWYKILGATKAVSSRAFTVDNNRIIIALDSTDRTNVCSMNLSSGAYATLFRQGGKSTTSSIQTDASGNIYMAGSCAVKGTLDFNGVSVPLSGMSAAYVAKYLYNYTHAWHHVMNDPTCMPRKVSVFKNKFIYYTGTLTDSLTLGGLSVHPPLLGLDFIAARLDTNGNVIWLRQLDTVASGEASLGTAAFHATVTPDTALVVFAQGHNFVNWGYNISTNLYGTYSSVVVSMGPGSDTRWARTAFADNVTDDRIAGEGNAVWVSGNAYTSTAATAFDTLNLKMPARRWVPYMAKLRLTRPPFVANGVGNVRGTEFAALPNPAHDAIRITGLSSHSVITLRDMNGRTVLEQTVAQGQAVLNVGELPRGLYFLQMRSGGISQVQKILLQ
jgi:hypothetical protein